MWTPHQAASTCKCIKEWNIFCAWIMFEASYNGTEISNNIETWSVVRRVTENSFTVLKSKRDVFAVFAK